MIKNGAYSGGCDDVPCPRSGLADSHASAGAPDGNPLTTYTLHNRIGINVKMILLSNILNCD